MVQKIDSLDSKLNQFSAAMTTIVEQPPHPNQQQAFLDNLARQSAVGLERMGAKGELMLLRIGRYTQGC